MAGTPSLLVLLLPAALTALLLRRFPGPADPLIWGVILATAFFSVQGQGGELWWANRAIHAGMAVVLTLLLARLISWRVGTPPAAPALVILLSAALAVSLGCGLEILESVADWNQSLEPLARWHDTILDLSANLLGGLLGALYLSLLVRREARAADQHPRKERPEDA